MISGRNQRRSASRWRALSVLLTALALGACGPTEVAVKGQFPAPLMVKLPVTLGVVYPADFSGHEFFDETTDRESSKWIVRTGEAQVDLWDTLLPGMFQQVVHLDSAAAGAGKVDAVLIPHVDELQYALPVQTNIKVYEIWMRYRFELLSPGGEALAEWSMPAYGKTPTAFLRSDQEAVNLAAVMALRDAGAHFATSFRQVPEVARWLQQGFGVLQVNGLAPAATSEEQAP